MSVPTPKPVNPYQVALGVLAGLLLLAGLISVLASLPEEADGFVLEEGSPAGRAAGALLLGAGAVLCVAWLAVSAVLWKRPVSKTDQP